MTLGFSVTTLLSSVWPGQVISLPGLISPPWKLRFLRPVQKLRCVSHTAGTGWLFQDGLHTRRCAACPFQCIQPPCEAGENLLTAFQMKMLRLRGVKWLVTQVLLSQGSQLRPPRCPDWNCGPWFPRMSEQLQFSSTPETLLVPSVGQMAGLRLCWWCSPLRTHSQLCLLYSFCA